MKLNGLVKAGIGAAIAAAALGIAGIVKNNADKKKCIEDDEYFEDEAYDAEIIESDETDE